MATIPIRDVPGDPVQPTGNELILIDNGIAMQKATINDAVEPKATEIADQKIADLNLGTAAQANVEDFATSGQGAKADSALQPTDIGTSVQAHGDFLDDLAAMDPGSAGQVIAFDPDGKPIPVDAGSGDMLKSVYDPDENSSNAFDLSNQYGNKPTDFPTVADLLADTSLGYSAARKADQVAEGDIIEAQGFRYEVAASGAPDAHVETAGGVKLYEAGPLFTSIDRMARSAGRTWAMITTGWRAGSFAWSDADHSAEVTADPEQGIYVAPTSDPTGASGAWVRQFEGAARFEWWGANNTGLAPTSSAIQSAVSAALELGIEDFDATGAAFNMTGGVSDVPVNPEFSGSAVIALKAGASLRIKGGKFFSTDPSEGTVLFTGVLLREFSFTGIKIDRSYVPSMIDDSNAAHGIAAYGVDLYTVKWCEIENVRGDAIYSGRDWVSPDAVNKNTGTIITSNNTLIACKRNFIAVTDFTDCVISENVCIGLPGGVWAISASIDAEPGQPVDDMGRLVVSDNIISGPGVQRGIRSYVAPNKIPSLYEAIVIANNVVDSDGLEYGIHVEGRGKLKQVSISANTVKSASPNAQVGIFLVECSDDSVVVGNVVEMLSGIVGIYYFRSSSGILNSPKGVISSNVIRRLGTGNFRAIYANCDGGSFVTANDNQCFAVDSTLNPIILSANTSTSGKAKTFIANGNSGDGFSSGISLINAEKAIAVGNGFAVAGSANTAEEFVANL